MNALSLLAIVLLVLPACSEKDDGKTPVPGKPGAVKTVASARAKRRAYDGAPPVIPHLAIRGQCLNCHNQRGQQIEGLGFAPPQPHGEEVTTGAMKRCRQCHLFSTTNDVFRDNAFVGLAQDLRHGERQHPNAPPRMPHPVFMRNNCKACHTGPAAREEIRTSHPERDNCKQCHLPIVTEDEFTR